MNQTARRLLIVDDEVGLLDTVSAVLRAEGYVTESATSAREAIEKVRAKFFDALLLDIRLPDMEGTELLSRFRKVASETIKIIITGYPSVENATQALNVGADAYLTKPLDPDCLLRTIREKMLEREEREKVTSKKVVEWVELRSRKTDISDFQQSLHKNAEELVCFGLTRNQAKTYIALNALGVALVSEIASLSKIRREEVYRIMPEIEKLGLATRKLGTPVRFSATKVKVALEALTNVKIEAMKDEIKRLRARKKHLITRLKRETMLNIDEREYSIETFAQRKDVLTRRDQLMRKAKKEITLICPPDRTGTMLLRKVGIRRRKTGKQINKKIVVDESWLGETPISRLLGSKMIRELLEMRYTETLPFSLLLVDRKEAIWGELHFADLNPTAFFTNDQTQIGVLRMAFENLWHQSQVMDKNSNLILDESKTSAINVV